MVQHRLSLMKERDREREIEREREAKEYRPFVVRGRRTLIMHRCHRYRRALYVWDRNVFPLLTLFPASLRKNDRERIFHISGVFSSSPSDLFLRSWKSYFFFFILNLKGYISFPRGQCANSYLDWNAKRFNFLI